MTGKPERQTYQRGVSIIILTRNGAHYLKRLFESFFEVNTYHPVELIVVDHASLDDTADVIARYAAKAFIKHIKRDRNYSFAASNNFAVRRAAYPHLLFLNNDIIYTSDALPRAVKKLEDPSIGAVGIRLDDDPDSLPEGKKPGIQHAGIGFKWDEGKEFFRPYEIRHKTLDNTVQSGFYPAVTGAFLLCRKADFEAVGGFCEEYEYALEDIDFCLQLGIQLGRKCFCLNDISLQHVGGASRKKVDSETQKKKNAHNDAVFKRRVGETIKALMQGHQESTRDAQTLEVPGITPKPSAPLHILFVLPGTADSNSGYQVERLIRGLRFLGAECIVAVPDESDNQNGAQNDSIIVFPYSHILQNGLTFSDGSGPDIIHAWTPREIVRCFVEALKLKYSCPVVVHLEDNEEYLAEAKVGRPFTGLARLPEKELDQLISDGLYHPKRGRRFLEEAQGLTMIIDTLEKFNFGRVPSLRILPPPDERLFYPRPINYALRRQLSIPDSHIVLVYNGNVHAGNKEEVLSLYQAVRILNKKGKPATLIRTGTNDIPLVDGNDSWIKAFEKPLGWIGRKELPEVMAAADILIQPGKPGPFNDYRIPCKLPEYFALGRPVILPRTNLGLMVEHNKEAYVLDVADAESIARAVLEISKDKEQAGQLAAGAAGFCRSRLINSFWRYNLIDFYQSAANSLKATAGAVD